MIDWWIMANITFNVGIFGFHIFLDDWIKKSQLAIIELTTQQVSGVVILEKKKRSCIIHMATMG